MAFIFAKDRKHEGLLRLCVSTCVRFTLLGTDIEERVGARGVDNQTDSNTLGINSETVH